MKNPDVEDYASLITARVFTDKGSYSLSGAIFGHKSPRIVTMNGLNIDIIPVGNLLLVKNNDKPGIIGQIGVLLGTNKINIASMQVGRNVAGGEAVTVIAVDSAVNTDLVQQIRQLPGVNAAVSVTF